MVRAMSPTTTRTKATLEFRIVPKKSWQRQKRETKRVVLRRRVMPRRKICEPVS
jgi:hypothetical protein